MFYRACAIAGICLALMVAAIDPLLAQPSKKILTFKDSEAWRSAGTPVLSPDGAFAVFTISEGEGKGAESIIRQIATGREHRFACGEPSLAARFTPDGKRAILSLTPARAELEKARAAKVKAEDLPQPRLAVVELGSGKIVDTFPQSGQYHVGGTGAGFVIYRKPARTSTATEKDAKPETPPGPMGGRPGKGKGGQFPGKGTGPAGPTSPTGTGYGTDLTIRDLGTKSERVIPDVAQFTLTRDGTLLIYTVASRKEEANGVYAQNPGSHEAAGTLKAGPGNYSGLTLDEKQTRVAFLYDDSKVTPSHQAPTPRPAGAGPGTPASIPPAPPVPPRWRIYVWDRSAKPAVASMRRVPIGATGGFASIISIGLAANPAAVAPVDEVFGPNSPGLRSGWVFGGGSLNFSPDGTRLYVNTAPKREPAASATPSPARPDDFQLDLWHWKDERLQPAQKLQAAADRARTYSAVVLLDSKQFRQLSDETITVEQPSDGDWAIASDNRKYRHTTGYGLPLSDYSAVNVRTGEKKSLMSGFGGYSTPRPNLSPTGKHMVGFDGKNWFTITVADGKRVVLTGKLKEEFYDEYDDHPGAPRAAGPAQWTADGKHLLVHDRYDIWKLAVDGSTAENLTRIGRPLQIRFTILPVRSGEEPVRVRGVDLSKPILLGAENLSTRDTGFYRLEPAASQPKLLIMGPRRYGTPTRARDADVYLLTVQTFSDYPDYFATGPDFHELKRITDINPRVREFNWGKSELVNFKSADGLPLSAVLIKPENFDPSKKYPMMVYIYERLSDTVHNFRLPTTGTSINPTFYASNGYLVLMPDIAYTVGTPGQSALKCVLPAIQAVCDRGYVNEGGIGIQGHSWGGYQIAYMVTQTNRFQAAVAGAPVTNMVSAYGGIRWQTGLTRQFQYEWTQSRIGAPLWAAPMKFIENSPIFMADRVKTPLLMLHNDEDGAVPWYQGIEFYLAMRRLEKECYLLNYNGQPHGLTNRAAARDYSARMFQFFEHHLKGKPQPNWMAKGVPFLDRDKDKDEIKKQFGPAKK